MNKKYCKLISKHTLLFIVVILSLIFSGFFEFSFDQKSITIGVKSHISNNDALLSELFSLEPINKTILEDSFDKYLADKKDNSDKWLTFMSILSTLFAVFFVYAGFKIESTKEKVDNAEKRVLDLEQKIEEDIYEYSRQLEYCMSFIMQKQFDKAIDALTVLRNEPFVLRDGRKINTCCFFLAHCYYERGIINRSKDDLAIAVQYIDEAIEDDNHPFKMEIVKMFASMDNNS
jgi:hypothetical protein